MEQESSKEKKRHVFVVSDATGMTCELVVKAALTQFRTSRAILHRVRYVRNPAQIQEVIQDARGERGIVVYTLVVPELRKVMLTSGLHHAVPTIDILGPVLSRLTDLLEISPMAKPGLFRGLDEDYFNRIEAINYAVKHDDGQRPQELSDADLVLVGVSRTSKTPISVYLSYRGFKVANVPILLDARLPRQLFKVAAHKVMGLTMRPERLQLLRQARVERYRDVEMLSYTDLETIKKELKHSIDICKQRKWQTFDVTLRSIEEAATVIMELLGKHMAE
jgi:regulator of PEP synthase PpsR (kinase-PPPase family)